MELGGHGTNTQPNKTGSAQQRIALKRRQSPPPTVRPSQYLDLPLFNILTFFPSHRGLSFLLSLSDQQRESLF
uniref:Uncharacterized protein n=1 Tax=Utricularia reniformis TaxID=192314 RepID=A0A1Y0B3V8_9LAMI|nr:hypothetical protein AEK19_MT1906 [Utricularia reniformis]ART32074.1 hypothetical protein AEK19_MT1906 [Utricularia reniformis]